MIPINLAPYFLVLGTFALLSIGLRRSYGRNPFVEQEINSVALGCLLALMCMYSLGWLSVQ